MGADLVRVAAIFGEARRLPAVERSACVAARCGDDAALRAEVDSLLAAHDAAGASDDVPLPLQGLGALARAAAEDVEGRSIGGPTLEGFRVLSRLAEGGMGSVYVAEQEQPRRRVALKVLRPEAATPEGRLRFEREAKVLARLEHPGIARVLVYGTTTGPLEPRPYLAMELVEGEPLTRATAGLDLRARVALLAEVAEAVAHAHAKGVVHRDLKPDNILVQKDGRPKVLDFGVARLLDDDGLAHTRAGQVIGTLAYMSPEQARGDSGSVDTRSDVYSLGVVAYEVLCGRHPLGARDGTFTEIVRRILGETPEAPAAIDRRLRGDLSLILGKALDKEPDQRYASASALAEDLRRYLADAPILARPLTGTYQVRRFLRRHKTLVAGSATALVLLVGGLVVALRLAHLEQVARRRADQSTAEMAQALADRSVELAASALREHEIESAARALDVVPAALRGWEWRYLAARLDESAVFEPLASGPLAGAILGSEGDLWRGRGPKGLLFAIDRGDPAPRGIALPEGMGVRALAARGGRGVAAVQNGAEFAVLDDRGHEIVAGSLSQRNSIQSVAFSPDKALVAVAQGGGLSLCPIHLVDTRTGAVVWRTWGTTIETRAMAFSPDGRLLAAAGGWDGIVRLIDVAARQALSVTPSGHTGLIESVAFAPDGERLVTGSSDLTARVWDVATGRETARLIGHSGPVLAVAFSPDGDRVATAGGDGTVRVWDPRVHRAERVLVGHRGAVRAVAFGEDGETLVSFGEDGRRTWHLADPAVLRVHDGAPGAYVYAARFSPDGGRLASVAWDGTAQIVELTTGAVERTLRLPRPEAFDLQWCQNGRSVVASGGRSCLVRWDAASGAEQAKWQGPASMPAVAALRDGSRILTVDERGTIRLHDAADLRPVATWAAGTAAIQDVALAPGDVTFALIDARGTVQVRRLADGELVWAKRAHEAAVFGAVAFSADGRRLASGGGDMRVRIWDAASGEEVRSLAGHLDPVYCLAWLPDGSRLFSGDRRALIRVWDPRSGRACLELRGHQDYVYQLDVAPDGETLASASGDATVRLWSTAARSASASPGAPATADRAAAQAEDR